MQSTDIIPVIRCKYCKNRGTPYNCPMRRLVHPLDGAGHYEDFTTDDSYCSYGVLKDAEEVNK